MRTIVLCFLLAASLAVSGCAMGPNNAEVETAFREAVARNDIMGFLSSAVTIEKFQVDKVEKRGNGVYEATVTLVSSAHVGPLSVGGARQTTLRLKKVGEQWVVLQ
ncbi:MAG: hypothetical protein AAGU21_05485 [Solidesulfovibrio sp.]|uniref:hypothetical protein n=1 Tax=Solidesulfovibrio sp. TaxID=2910990 RepID=UPI002B20871A|nr:hypothetical protein [Solidesulfovibrio sp.]MEA4857220.1 hypothetical protein [Solidesulfovibrio sp.]